MLSALENLQAQLNAGDYRALCTSANYVISEAKTLRHHAAEMEQTHTWQEKHQPLLF